MIAFAHNLSRPYVLVLLAGALHPSPLRRQLDIPVLALPIARERTLLDAWLETIEHTAAPIARLILVTSSPKDAEVMRELVESRHRGFEIDDEQTLDNQRHRPTAAPAYDIEVMIDPAQWRGPAGLLRDIATGPAARNSFQTNGDSRTPNFSAETLFACAEAAVLPPRTLDPLLVRRADDSLAGAIGAAQQRGDRADGRHKAAELRPAGVYAFTADAILTIPPIGFHDIKEQLLPSLYRSGKRVPVVPFCREVVRVRDLDSYLLAVRRSLGHAYAISRSMDAAISDSAVLSGACIVQDEVTIEDGAVIHESVVMRGARIGGGSVVARSVIGSGASIGARSVVRNAVVAPVARPLPKWTRPRKTINRLALRALPGGR